MDAKWITGLSPDMPIREAANKVLAARLDAVRYWLPLVAHAEKDEEFVHQLRVTTRRAGAALRLFRPCLRRRDYRDAKNLLRELRQTAGEARDWDVFQEWLFGDEIPGNRLRDFLFGFAISERMNAQVDLSRIAFDGRKPLDHLCEVLSALLADPIEADIPKEYGALCLSTVRGLLAELHRATHPVPDDYHDLHQVRILMKKIRYVLELGVDCFRAVRETILLDIEDAQEILGAANDAHVREQNLEEIAYFVKKFRPAEYPLVAEEMETLRHTQEVKLTQQKTRFVDWLAAWDEADHALTLKTAVMSGA